MPLIKMKVQSDKNSLLRLAAYNDDLECVVELLRDGADVMMRPQHCWEKAPDNSP
jgi:hypothetical protein